jgi:hypothetical protein
MMNSLRRASAPRERAASYGATVHAGPAPDGGWRLTARLPRSA